MKTPLVIEAAGLQVFFPALTRNSQKIGGRLQDSAQSAPCEIIYVVRNQTLRCSE
jgi:hypothetical protein